MNAPISSHAPHEIAGSTPGGGRSRSKLIVVLIGAFALGVLSASFPEWRSRVQQVLLQIGGAHLANLEAIKPTQLGASEYWVVLKKGVDSVTARRFIDSHPGLRYLEASAFPRTLRITIQVPVNSAKQELEAQPFTQLVLPSHLLLFCQ